MGIKQGTQGERQRKKEIHPGLMHVKPHKLLSVKMEEEGCAHSFIILE
jgi:hypothetical protein